MIIREFTVIHGVEDFRNICKLSLVCKQFHQFIKNQLIPNERLLFFVQKEDLILDEYTKKYKVKRITNAPFKKLGIIFPRRFLIQEYPVINFMGSFPKIEELGLLMNCYFKFSSDPSFTCFGKTLLEFGEKIDSSKSMITIDYSYSLDDKYDHFKSIHDSVDLHTVMISNGTDRDIEKRKLMHPCFCIEEFPSDIREKYGYKGWSPESLELMKFKYENLERYCFSFLREKISFLPSKCEAYTQTEYNSFKFFFEKKQKLIFNKLIRK